MKLTSHERIERIFQNKEIDRPALKLWGACVSTDWQLHPDYLPVSKLAAETTDIFESVGLPFNIHAGQNIDKYEERYTTETNDPDWYNEHTVFHTPKGDLHMINRASKKGEPGYIMEHMVKEPEDIDKLLSMDYEPYQLDRKVYDDAVSRIGERGVAMVGLEHAGYAVQTLMGSETLSLFSVDERDKLDELVKVYADRVLAHTKAVIDTGIRGIFSWVGPELYLPPLMSPRDFQQYVHDMDKPICDLIHNAGGHVWVHCHGKVAKFIDSFMNMGVDVLNPLEPPKNGDIDMERIIEKYGNKIGWEGNIEIQEILLSPQQRLRQLIDECVEAGNKSGRFILCPSAGYMEYPQPTKQYIDNLMFYLQYGLQAVERCRK
ncbi:MAG: hypothetical protein E7491_10120 [Ruminococcaceae bacterium]|nr:hypothetical protein [Oscillospiraceae bacterium]